MIESFTYKNNQLCAVTENGLLTLQNYCDGKAHPLYVYNQSSLKKRLSHFQNQLKNAKTRLFYAVKANAHPKILEVLRQNGHGVDVVSGGEALWALENGFLGKDIIFSGVGKSKEEILLALKNDVFQINAESIPEIQRIADLARSINKKASLGIRINPNIKPDTHPYITTGFRENKFGISEYQLSEALDLIRKNQDVLKLQGLSAHIGSQIRDLQPLTDTVHVLLSMARNLKTQNFNLTTLDFGGGIGIDYFSENEESEYHMMSQFSKTLQRASQEFDGQLLLEPGRTLVARCGALLTQIEYVKFNGYKKFLVVNTGMHHLLRPSLYKAHHRILPLQHNGTNTGFYDVVGPICESSDVLGYDRQFPEMKEGDWLAIMDSGAYGMSMSSFYNRHQPPEEIIIP